MTGNEMIELRHQIERLIDKIEIMEKEHDHQHKEILAEAKENNKNTMKIITFVSALMTIVVAGVTILGKVGVL